MIVSFGESIVARYKLSDIPELDKNEFTWYRAANRTGEYFWQNIINGFLNTGHLLGWIPIGKTNHPKVMEMSENKCNIAIMYQWQNDSEKMIWFHLYDKGE